MTASSGGMVESSAPAGWWESNELYILAGMMSKHFVKELSPIVPYSW